MHDNCEHTISDIIPHKQHIFICKICDYIFDGWQEWIDSDPKNREKHEANNPSCSLCAG